MFRSWKTPSGRVSCLSLVRLSVVHGKYDSFAHYLRCFDFDYFALCSNFSLLLESSHSFFIIFLALKLQIYFLLGHVGEER